MKSIPICCAAMLVLVAGACRGPQLETQTFELEYLDAHTAASLIEPYVYFDRERNPGTVSTAGDMASHLITVRETRDNLEKIERVLSEYDQPAPMVQLHFQLIEANGTATQDPAIDDVESALRRLFKFEGYRLVADANTGWLMHDAARVVRGVRDVDVYIEEPCASYEECLSIRRRTDHPFVMDECMNGMAPLLRAHADGGADVVNIKISKFGGLTKAKLARDLCVSLGIAMTIEDSWGGDVTTAAIACLAHSTPTDYLFTSTDFNSYVTVSNAAGAPQRQNGRLAASTEPGLGIAPRLDVLGEPVLEVT